MTVTLLSPSEVADRLKLARSTIAKLRLAGGGPPFVKLGAAVRYPEDQLGEWIAAQPRRTSTSVADKPRAQRRCGRKTASNSEQLANASTGDPTLLTTKS